MAVDHCMKDVAERIAHGTLARQLGHVRLETGQLVCEETMPEDGFLLARSGRLRAFVSSEGRELTLFLLWPGDAIRIGHGPQLEARRPTDLVVLPMATLRAYAHEDPELVVSALAEAERLVERSIRMIEDIAFHDVERRLIRALCDAAEREGRQEDTGIVIRSPPNAEDLAMRIGATRQSVSTVMARLIRSGVLARYGQQSLVISDMEELRRHLVTQVPASG